ncbi:hypothetical protein K469DRAFT_304560 [Zopfia rhizophila CBS 207.26]|uniref:Uncharacterized protein n=1 Tax=Zopfia rhizophila CBS 207.26 TaxID=1314779 RepID=A0A6A6DJH4_9PEZI|nr:hypothetical protein K469DRAFT_304560 [Zopfia rhizophila CBS 207.26]
MDRKKVEEACYIVNKGRSSMPAAGGRLSPIALSHSLDVDVLSNCHVWKPHACQSLGYSSYMLIIYAYPTLSLSSISVKSQNL